MLVGPELLAEYPGWGPRVECFEYEPLQRPGDDEPRGGASNGGGIGPLVGGGIEDVELSY